MQEITKTSLGRICLLSKPEDIFLITREMSSHMGNLSHYGGYGINVDSIYNFFSNKNNLNLYFVYAYLDREDKIKSSVWWCKNYDARINKKILTEYIWHSIDPKYSIRVFKESLKHIYQTYKYDVVLTSETQGIDKLKKIYKKMGFEKEGEIFYRDKS